MCCLRSLRSNCLPPQFQSRAFSAVVASAVGSHAVVMSVYFLIGSGKTSLFSHKIGVYLF